MEIHLTTGSRAPSEISNEVRRKTHALQGVYIMLRRDSHVDHVILFLASKISNAVRSAISTTAGFLVMFNVKPVSAYSFGILPGFPTLFKLVTVYNKSTTNSQQIVK